jgi:hypothetical protein
VIARRPFGCGETSEVAAARAHRVITVFYTVVAIGLAGALATVSTMIAWHRASSRIHTDRAIERGELIVAPLLTLALLCALGGGTLALAHPGRLDATGCHIVRRDFRYADGRVLPKGERHCHRPLDAMKLGEERFGEDPPGVNPVYLTNPRPALSDRLRELGAREGDR